VILVCTSGGAGEGKQHLTPSGSLKNVHQVKSDEALPFYCHPPNPCPKGYTGQCRTGSAGCITPSMMMTMMVLSRMKIVIRSRILETITLWPTTGLN